MSAAKFMVYKDDEQWIGGWSWAAADDQRRALDNGSYLARWMAWLAGWWSTR